MYLWYLVHYEGSQSPLSASPWCTIHVHVWMIYKIELNCIAEILFVADPLLLVSFFTFSLTMAAMSRLMSTTLRLRSWRWSPTSQQLRVECRLTISLSLSLPLSPPLSPSLSLSFSPLPSSPSPHSFLKDDKSNKYIVVVAYPAVVTWPSSITIPDS